MSENCSTCHGSGKEKCKMCGATGIMTCPDCRGTGRLACDHCRGHGKRLKDADPFDKEAITGIDDRTYIVTDDECPYCHRHMAECYNKWFVWEDMRVSYSASVVCGRCGGTGKVKCSRCHGTKMQKCSECQAREDKAAEERRAAKQKAKERADTRMGCGYLLVICALLCLMIWGPDWFEGSWIGSVLGWIRQASWVVMQWIWKGIKFVFEIIAVVAMMIVGLIGALISIIFG